MTSGCWVLAGDSSRGGQHVPVPGCRSLNWPSFGWSLARSKDVWLSPVWPPQGCAGPVSSLGSWHLNCITPGHIQGSVLAKKPPDFSLSQPGPFSSVEMNFIHHDKSHWIQKVEASPGKGSACLLLSEGWMLLSCTSAWRRISTWWLSGVVFRESSRDPARGEQIYLLGCLAVGTVGSSGASDKIHSQPFGFPRRGDHYFRKTVPHAGNDSEFPSSF